MMPVNPKLTKFANAPLVLCNRILSQVLQWLVRVYQLTLSPFIGNQCRFHPTCSHYAMESLQRHGPWQGSWLAAKRLGRCQPFAEGGFDPVPQAVAKAPCEIHTPKIQSVAPPPAAPTFSPAKETL